MIKSILVPVAGTEDDKGQLRSALTVARTFGAHLNVLHVCNGESGLGQQRRCLRPSARRTLDQ